MKTLAICLSLIVSMSLCGCLPSTYLKKIAMSDTIITESELDDEGEMKEIRKLKVSSRSDAKVKITRSEEGFTADIDNRGRPGWVESMAERLIDKTDIVLGSGVDSVEKAD